MDKIYYFHKAIALVKEILEDKELTEEEKVRILGAIF